MNIEEIADHIITTLKTVSALDNRVGLVVGGKDLDPINKNLTRPACWVVYTGDDNETPSDFSPGCDMMKINFEVRVLIDYDNENNLKATHLPLLHTIASALRGTSPILGTKWVYEGQYLLELTGERMVWNQNYSVTAPL